MRPISHHVLIQIKEASSCFVGISTGTVHTIDQVSAGMCPVSSFTFFKHNWQRLCHFRSDNSEKS